MEPDDIVKLFGWPALILFGLACLNALIGACVWFWLDRRREGALYRWYCEADHLPYVGAFLQFLFLNLWPLGVILRLFGRL